MGMVSPRRLSRNLPDYQPSHPPCTRSEAWRIEGESRGESRTCWRGTGDVPTMEWDNVSSLELEVSDFTTGGCTQ